MVLFFWLLLFENISLFSLWGIKSKINTLESEWEYKELRIQEAEEKKAIILSNPEKYARETYRMKKQEEELFIIVPDKK